MTWQAEPLPLDGAALKDQGMARALNAAEVWREAAMAWMRALPRGEWFTADDVVAAVGLPHGEIAKEGNNAVGAVVNAASRGGLIERVSYVTALRPNSHARTIGLWRRA